MPKPNRTGIKAVVFGDDDDIYLSLPYSFDQDNPPMVRVICGDKSAVAAVRGSGPWTMDDERYVMGSKRPIAEHCFETMQPLPSGPMAGQVPTNSAGIILSPALAREIGVSDKDVVSWEFVDDGGGKAVA